jgi:hypothetical protein
MGTWSKPGVFWFRLVVVVTLVFVYFVAFPQDLAGVISPVERVLALSNAVSPWLYGVVAVAIVTCTAVRIWGRKSTAADQ